MTSCLEHGLAFVEGCQACAACQEGGYDWRAAAISLAAMNERLCRIALEADKIVEYVDQIGLVKYAGHRKLEAMLTEYKIVRQGS